MKTIIFSVATLLLVTQTLSAQKLDAVKVGIDNNNGQVSYTIPQTTLQIDVKIVRETIKKGPYARFSQKLLGVIAPLTDKDIYTIKGASMSVAQYASPKISPKTTSVLNYVSSDTSFIRVAPDKMQILDKSPEEMASMAANTIYMLRKRRIELVTGDVGENVYGAGLSSALAEIGRLEQEYLALFLGKVVTTSYTETLYLTPESTKPNYVVARFTDNAGIVGEDNLSGRPLVVEIRVDKRYAPANSPSKSSKNMETYRLAEMVNCRLMDVTREIVSARIPMLQYGSDHAVSK